MRLFKRKPKVCDSISFTYFTKDPEKGVCLDLGCGKDKIDPGLSKRDIARYHFSIKELDYLIDHLRFIRSEFNTSE